MPKEIKKEEEDIQEINTQHYELIYLIPNKYSENELEPIQKNVLKLIKDKEGEITYEENWGKKKLAYPIKHFFYAYYYLIEFDLPAKNLKKINNTLSLNEEILRHLVIKRKLRTKEEIKREKIKAEEIAKKEKEEEKEEEKAKKKITMEELDEKLDKILDTDTLNI